MDVAAIEPRLRQRLDELQIDYNQVDAAIGRRSGWLSGVLTGKQKTIKLSDLNGLCAVLGVSEPWLRGEDLTGKGGQSLFVVAPPPSKAPPAKTIEGFISRRRDEIDAEIEILKGKIKALEAERRQLGEAAKAVKRK